MKLYQLVTSIINIAFFFCLTSFLELYVILLMQTLNYLFKHVLICIEIDDV